MHIPTIQALILQAFEKKGLSSTVQIARAAGLNQSCVYRALNGKPTRLTKNLRILCEAAEIDLDSFAPDPTSNETLMSALKSSWDGTEAHAKFIAKLLKLISSVNSKK